MNEHELDHTIEGFLDVGPEVAPEHVHLAVAMEFHGTSQVRNGPGSWWRSSAGQRSDFSSLIVGAAAAVLFISLAVGLLTAGPALLGGDQRTPTLTAEPTATATATAAGSPALPSPEVRPGSADYTVGNHRLEVDGVRFSFDIRKFGWEPHGTIHVSKSEIGPQGAEGLVYWTAYPEGEDVAACGPWINEPETQDPSDLAERMARAPGVEILEAPTDVALGRHGGRRLVVRIRENLGCDPGYFFSWMAKSDGALWQQTHVGDTLRVWIMSVNSTTFFVVAQTSAEASEPFTHELVQIAESIRFEQSSP